MAKRLYDPPAPQPIARQENEPEPLLQLGRVQACEGFLSRQSKILKRWKIEWLQVVPGSQTLEIVKPELETPLYTLNSALNVEPLSNDRKSKDFLGFRIVNTDDDTEVCRFRAGDIVTMRKFMTCLGCKTDAGLFCRGYGEEGFVEAMHGLWDIAHPAEGELSLCKEMLDMHIKEKELACEKAENLADFPLCYDTAANHVSMGFYFNKPPQFNGLGFDPVHSGASRFNHVPKVYRRQYHDTFLPPWGPAVLVPVSLGQGAEIGLPDGVQEFWDPGKEAYFFVDHVNKATFFDDPRPIPKPVPVLSTGYGHNNNSQVRIPPGALSSNSIIESTTKRALARPHGFVLSANGVNGENGKDGDKGAKGEVGEDGKKSSFTGSSGEPGSTGGSGGSGMDGTKGTNALEASNVVLNIQGNSEELFLSGTYDGVVSLGGNKAEEIVFVNCRGGNGGDGGRGGKGGKGGVGGLGGKGARGYTGASNPSGPGYDGGPGGPGGKGGRGGTGGLGGKGGDGGQASKGAVCVFETTDPSLLMLVDADCMRGSPGAGGEGGEGGKGGIGGVGGKGGRGGAGGSGGTYTNSKGESCRYSSGSSGPSGLRGSAGETGQAGARGSKGSDGKAAKNGAILWIIRKPDGRVLRQSATRYDLEVSSLKLSFPVDDGIVEPNDRILVSEIEVMNSGGLPLPEGASVFMPSTKTVKFEPTRFVLPSEKLPPHRSYVIPDTFQGRIFDQPPPNAPGPFVASADFHPRAELLGRPFEKSFLEQKLVIQYPVKLQHLKSSENLGRGEVSVLEVGVQNISTLPYGSCDGSGGKVELRLHMDARLIPVETDQECDLYSISHNPLTRDSMIITVHKIPPGETLNVQISIQMELKAELLDRCLWQADLYLRDKLIEYNFEKVRVAPFYIPREPTADVLMVTSDAISRKGFVFWQHILQTLNVSVDYWDTIRYNGLSLDSQTNKRHQVTWEGKYCGKMVLYPHCNLELLQASDIPRHFHGTDYQDSTLKELHSSMLLFLPDSEKRGPSAKRFADLGDQQVLKYLSVVEDPQPIPDDVDYGGKHIFQPGTLFVSSKPYLKWERNYLQHLEEEHPTQAPVVLSRVSNVNFTGYFSYDYGKVDIRLLPILRSSKFMVVDGAGGSVVNMGRDDNHLLPACPSIPLATNYGQVLLLVLHGLPLFNKIQLLKNRHEKHEKLELEKPADTVAFLLPNGGTVSLPELTMISVANEVSDELYSYTATAERMQLLAHSILENVEVFTDNGQVILQGLKLLKKEMKKRSKKVTNASLSLAVEEIKSYVTKLKHTLKRAGVKKSKKVLIPLEYLLSREHVHRSHQHWTEDEQERWNLAGE